MIDQITMEGPTVAEALDAALEEMGVQQDAVDFEILSEPTKGLFGGAGKPARVRVWLRGGVKAPVVENEPDEDEYEEDDETDELQPTTQPPFNEGVPDLTDEQLDQIADTGVGAIQSIMGALGIQAAVEEYEGDEGEIILDIVGDELGILIGRHGRTLDALQILVSTITNRKLDQRYPLVVDVSGYRHRRRLKLEEIARRAADRASRQHRPVALRPMTSFERRVIHVVLREDRRVATESEGEEPRRMVVVRPR